MSCDCTVRGLETPSIPETPHRMDLALQRWLQQNPFLAPLATFEAQVRGAAEAVTPPALVLAPWAGHRAEHGNGVALLLGQSHGTVLQAAAADLLGPASERAVLGKLPPPLAEGMREVREVLVKPAARTAAIQLAPRRGLARHRTGAARAAAAAGLAHLLSPALALPRALRRLAQRRALGPIELPALRRAADDGPRPGGRADAGLRLLHLAVAGRAARLPALRQPGRGGGPGWSRRGRPACGSTSARPARAT